jgi:hypothetical protein
VARHGEPMTSRVPIPQGELRSGPMGINS